MCFTAILNQAGGCAIVGRKIDKNGTVDAIAHDTRMFN
jgi:hypothetical protein